MAGIKIVTNFMCGAVVRNRSEKVTCKAVAEIVCVTNNACPSKARYLFLESFCLNIGDICQHSRGAYLALNR